MPGTQPVVVTLPAEIDVANADSISVQIAAAVAFHPKTVIADMTATTFCDSLGVRVLVLAHHHAAAHGTELRLLLPCPGVMRIMEVLGVDAVLPIYQSLEEALAGGGAAEAGSGGATENGGHLPVAPSPGHHGPRPRSAAAGHGERFEY